MHFARSPKECQEPKEGGRKRQREREQKNRGQEINGKANGGSTRYCNESDGEGKKKTGKRDQRGTLKQLRQGEKH